MTNKKNLVYVINSLNWRSYDCTTFYERKHFTFLLVYPFWNGTCLEHCIFNANVNLQKKTYLGDKFIAIRPWNHELHIQLLCNLIYLFGKRISLEHKNACFNSNIVKYIEMTYSWSQILNKIFLLCLFLNYDF